MTSVVSHFVRCSGNFCKSALNILLYFDELGLYIVVVEDKLCMAVEATPLKCIDIGALITDVSP